MSVRMHSKVAQTARETATTLVNSVTQLTCKVTTQAPGPLGVSKLTSKEMATPAPMVAIAMVILGTNNTPLMEVTALILMETASVAHAADDELPSPTS